MKTKFTISKDYNHFFFVQTLADWHFSCRPEYIEKWLKETGSLTEQEQEASTAFNPVLKKYGFDPIKNCPAANGFDFFMRYDQFKDGSPFSREEIDIYLNAMKSLGNRFNKIWKTESVNLEKVQKLLNDKFNLSNNDLISDLKTLFQNQINFNAEIEIVLLLSMEESGAGGANNGPNIVTLECGSTNPQNLNYLLSTLWHEITHLILDDYFEKTALILKNNKLIKEASIEAKKINFNYSEELLSFSIFSPMSYLTNRYFPTEIGRELYDAISKENTEWLLETRYIFIMYLIYLNGQSIKKNLDADQSVSPQEMASAIIENHKIIERFFLKNNKEPIWINYN